jgi:hypothetical protein
MVSAVEFISLEEHANVTASRLNPGTCLLPPQQHCKIINVSQMAASQAPNYYMPPSPYLFYAKDVTQPV